MRAAEFDDAASAASVGDLVRRRLSDSDRWNLALVQRDAKWTEERMRHLVDSLLRGYPIGAILLCRVKADSREIRVVDGVRNEQAAAPHSWQLLDGQQRINALHSVFSPGNYGRFYLNMVAPLDPPSPAQSRTAKQRVLGHIQHCTEPDDTFPGRDRHVDLSRWVSWAAGFEGSDASFEAITDGSVTACLRGLDERFTDTLNPSEAETAAANLRLLIEAWTVPSIPILRATVGTPSDVLEVFTRINLGGVNVAGSDVYLAGVKTFWRDTETRLDALLVAAPFLANRLGALRFLSRLAAKGLGYTDVLSLSIDRLSGRKGTALLQAMAELTGPGSAPLSRLDAFSTWYRSGSQLGYGLKQAAPDLWDDVLAWAASSPRTDPAWYEANRAALDAYLLGGTLFGYRTMLGDAFRRIAFLESLGAGSCGEQFPLERILAITRSSTRLLGSRGRRVPGLDTGDDRRFLASRNGWLLTALAQRIPYEWEPENKFDWDHIIPKAHATRMWAPGAAGRRRYHPNRHLINSTGNFWALHYSINRSLGKSSGEDKFKVLRRLADDPDEARVWPQARWAITQAEIDAFNTVDRMLRDGSANDDPATLDGAMQIFKDTVECRSARLLDEAIDRFGQVARFASDDDLEAELSTIDLYQRFLDALGLSDHDPVLLSLSRDEASAAIATRAIRLKSSIDERLTARANLAESWIWRRPRGAVETCIGFTLADGSCTELVLTWAKETGVLLRVKAYAQRGKARDLYPEFDHVPLRADWATRDDSLAELFLDQVARVQQCHPRPSILPSHG